MKKHDRIAVLSLVAFALAPLFLTAWGLGCLQESHPGFRHFMTSTRGPSWGILAAVLTIPLAIGALVYAGGLVWVRVMRMFLPKEVVRKWATLGAEGNRLHSAVVDCLLK